MEEKLEAAINSIQLKMQIIIIAAIGACTAAVIRIISHNCIMIAGGTVSKFRPRITDVMRMRLQKHTHTKT